MQPSRAISPNLDLLRSIAVLCVFFSHLFGSLGRGQIGDLGQFGVILFFVHTSFVLMGSLGRLDQHAESKRRLMIRFWVRRIFRIYPLAILFILLAIAFRIPIAPGFQYHWAGLKPLLSNLVNPEPDPQSQYSQRNVVSSLRDADVSLTTLRLPAGAQP
jgi:peptidoglycan/LPS O-acetylase OafA/YrhL